MSLPTKAVLEPIMSGTLISFFVTKLSFPKVPLLQWRDFLLNLFDSGIWFVYITVYNSIISKPYYQETRLYASY